MFKKFFGKKNDGFYMQIEDDAPTPEVPAKAKPSQTAVPAPAATPTATIAAPAAPAATVAAAAPAATPTATIAVPAAPAATVTPLTPADKKVADAEKAAAKALVKAEKKAAKKTADAEKAAAAAAPPSIVPAPALPAVTNFATDYLIKPSSDSTRRRPGANMNKFLELAREAKIPVNVKK